MDNGPSPVDLDLPVSIASVMLAAASRFAFPILTPLSAAVFLYSVIPSFKGAYHVAFEEKRLGVDLLDAIVVAACLATNQILAGSVLGLTLSISRKLVEKTEQNSRRMLVNVFGKQPRFVWLDKDRRRSRDPLEKLRRRRRDHRAHGQIRARRRRGRRRHGDGGPARAHGRVRAGEEDRRPGARSDNFIAGKIRIAVTSAGEETTSAKLAQILNDTAGYTLDAQSKGEKLADRAVAPTLALGAISLAARGVNSAVAVVNSDLGTGIRMAGPWACSAP